MAVTSLWHIKGSLKDLVEYVENPEKTTPATKEMRDFFDVFSYVQRPEATRDGEYVTAINCLRETALQQMILTKKQYGKEDKYIAWHGYQSFKPGEVTPEICHKIGVPLEVWQTKQTTIEGALDITIAKMVWAKGRKVIRVYAVPAAGDLPSLLPWQDKYLSKRNFELVLGEGITGPVTVNLAYVPHVLLGGSTGSGKSVLLKLLLMQALRKGAKVYIADFKGGVDFRAIWHQKCRMCFEEHDLLDMLTELVDKLEQRKKSFQVFGAANIDEYNEAEGTDLPRYVFACDEVAEMLDKTGLTKEQKELVSQIEGKLSTIARQGRAFGIHLILATQRPDATIIPGQIKNNIDFRVCGRADNVLSQIILDSTAAADQIPKDARGRFITRDGTVFQAFLFDEGEL